MTTIPTPDPAEALDAVSQAPDLSIIGGFVGVIAAFLIFVLAPYWIDWLITLYERRQKAKKPVKKPVSPAVKDALKAGEDTMVAAWWLWALGDRPEQALLIDSRTSYPPYAPSDGNRQILLPGYAKDRAKKAMETVPDASWSIERIRRHASTVWTYMEALQTESQPTASLVRARLNRCAAIVSDLRSDTFDTATGQTRMDLVLSQEPGVAAAYVEGGAKGVEKIMETIITTRTTLLEEARAQKAHEALTEQRTAELGRIAAQRNAHLAALRETNSKTVNLDNATAFEKAMRELETPHE